MWTHQSWQQSFMKSLEQNLAPRWNCNEPQLSPLHCLGSSVLCLTSSPKSLVIPRDTQITPSGCVSSDPLLAFGHDLSFQNWDKVEIMSHFSSEDPNYFFLFMVRYLSEPRCFIVPVSWNTIRVYLHTCFKCTLYICTNTYLPIQLTLKRSYKKFYLWADKINNRLQSPNTKDVTGRSCTYTD